MIFQRFTTTMNDFTLYMIDAEIRKKWDLVIFLMDNDYKD